MIMLEKPMTTGEWFQKIKTILEEKGKLPSMIDYSLASNQATPIKTESFNWENDLDYGSSEGIYLTIYIGYYEEGRFCREKLGTFKTLQDDEESMHAMATLLADFIIEGTAYVDNHLDDFRWTGFDVYPVDEAGKKLRPVFTCGSLSIAINRKDVLMKEYARVVVRDNATRKVYFFGNGVNEVRGEDGKKGNLHVCEDYAIASTPEAQEAKRRAGCTDNTPGFFDKDNQGQLVFIPYSYFD